ncbi:hypothetical protein H257_12773 [Aphanomyces astaci]|uniref:HORMA domain-containing protein n=1 Tax=Aphanomyces astaci TaxID=112090 RepID=W4FWS5_APHAT|nr:hypothetical protein H257_12773 [Aphanomyces astaci]ETV71942.1 hypothetical protein H257_12773 [Aphanomyces astaci]|eukprot:XP_009838385.1 hypothetical protein H257_12773 [Aphanomyces astaci]
MAQSQGGRIRITLKSAVKSTPMVVAPHTPGNSKITETQSLNVIKNLIRVSISEICYLRNLFPDEVFKERVYADMQIKCLAPQENSRDQSMQDAYSITEWLEAGAFDAMEKKYLLQLEFCIYALGKNKTPQNLLECYTYKIKETSNGSTFSTSFTGTQNIDSHPEKVKTQAVQMIRNLVSITNTLEPLPKSRYITMKLSYNDLCPSGWQPKYFKELTSDLGESFGESTLKLDVGRMATPFHAISMKLEAAESAFGTGVDAPSREVDISLSQANIVSNEDAKSPAVVSPSPEKTTEGIRRAKPGLPFSQPLQRQTRSPALTKDGLIRYCIQFKTVTIQEIEDKLGYDLTVIKKCMDELCAENVFTNRSDGEYEVMAQQDCYYFDAINLIHGKLRRHISVHTLAKCMSWSIYFAKAILWRMNHDKLIDMEREVAFDGYKVVLEDANRSIIQKAIQSVAEKAAQTTKTPGKKTPQRTSMSKPRPTSSCAYMPILQSNQMAKKRRVMISRVAATPMSMTR